MKLWIIGLLLLGIVIPLINGQDSNDDDEDYEVKRFHVQGRQLNGGSTCFETRRKRSVQQADDESQTSNGDDDEEDSTAEEMEVSTSEGREQDESSGILIRDSDLAGNAGILVIQNGVPPSTPFLFELRPVLPEKQNAYFQVVDPNDSDASDDPDFGDDVDDMENNNNRFTPSSDLDSDSDEYEDTSPSRPPVRPTPKPKRKRPSSQDSDEDVMKPIKKKPKRPSSQSLNNNRRPSRKNNKKKNKNKTKNKNKKKRKNSNRYGTNSESSIRRKVNSNKRLGTSVNKGSGTRTVTNTVTTTQTGAGSGDIPDVNCIIINKPSQVIPTQRPFWNILGRSAGERQSDRSFGLRKRITQKLFRQE